MAKGLCYYSVLCSLAVRQVCSIVMLASRASSKVSCRFESKMQEGVHRAGRHGLSLTHCNHFLHRVQKVSPFRLVSLDMRPKPCYSVNTEWGMAHKVGWVGSQRIKGGLCAQRDYVTS